MRFPRRQQQERESWIHHRITEKIELAGKRFFLKSGALDHGSQAKCRIWTD
jgi:hypothetical protein